MVSGIYSITNKVNGKAYIGYAKNFVNRWKHHISALNLGNHANTHLQSAWNKNGAESFKFEIIEQCNVDNLCDREHHWCIVFNTHNPKFGYNIKPTDPTGRSKYQAPETIEKIRGKLTGRKSAKLSVDKLRKTIGRAVVALTEDGVFVGVFQTMSDAQEEFGVGKGNMALVLSGKRKSSKGYIFVYKENYDQKKCYSIKRNYGIYSQKPIGMYTKNDNLVRVFNSVSEASRLLNISRTGISNALIGRSVLCNNYKWKYLCSNN